MYSYFPRIEGMLSDGINAFSPEYQPDEFFDALVPDVKECLIAYGCRNYVDMLGTNEEPGPWYPMYSYSEMLTPESEAARVWDQMNRVKRDYLPRVVMTDDFLFLENRSTYKSVHCCIPDFLLPLSVLASYNKLHSHSHCNLFSQHPNTEVSRFLHQEDH